MKIVHYSLRALISLRERGAIGARLRETIEDHAAGATPAKTAVARLAHSPARRLRLGEDRVIFEARRNRLVVTKVGRRGDVFDEGRS